MSNRTLDSSNLQPALIAKAYTSFASNINLREESAVIAGISPAAGEPCRRIRITGAGNVSCYFAGAPTTKVVIPFAVGDVDDVQLVTIGSAADGTTATGIVVYW
jgi:hypothetical protein